MQTLGTIRTVTIHRENQDITVEFDGGHFAVAIDEDGRHVQLTAEELATATQLVRAGHDETGR